MIRPSSAFRHAARLGKPLAPRTHFEVENGLVQDESSNGRYRLPDCDVDSNNRTHGPSSQGSNDMPGSLGADMLWLAACMGALVLMGFCIAVLIHGVPCPATLGLFC